MPRPIPGYQRPHEITCLVCRGPVPVAPRGTIPEGHPACMELRRTLTRLNASADAVAFGRTPAELRELARVLNGELRSIANAWVNANANPAKRGR